MRPLRKGKGRVHRLDGKFYHARGGPYLAFCRERGEDPDKPFTGKFVVRISPELHRKIYLSAKLSNESINAWLNENLDRVVNEELKGYIA